MNTNKCKTCHQCKWWQLLWNSELGCYNSNWVGPKSDPEHPVCGGLSFTPKQEESGAGA